VSGSSPAPGAPREVELPESLRALRDLALDLRWTWSHAADAVWRRLNPGHWALKEDPWLLLLDLGGQRLKAAAQDAELVEEIQRLDAARRAYLAEPSWLGRQHADGALPTVAYFCMEFGVGEALPLYAGGLGVLAGDYLKAASDLGLPAVGVGLLYEEGYFRQLLDSDHMQQESFPYNNPFILPVQAVESPAGGLLHVDLELPGRMLRLRVWQATVGRVKLYLLDSNDPLNRPRDRGITSKLYGGGPELRFLQEIVLGIGGWMTLEVLGIEPDICHLNEGHAAFAVLERARSFMVRTGVSFETALWATRPGNVFTTHTPIEAAFDRFQPALIQSFLPYIRIYTDRLGIEPEALTALGQLHPGTQGAEQLPAYMALRTSGAINGVSELHGAVSRRLFSGLFPRWPLDEVPVSHVTNGVHMPTWDSPQMDRVWERACGKERWRKPLSGCEANFHSITDEELWRARAEARAALLQYVRKTLALQTAFRGGTPREIEDAHHVLDPNALTVGFARRFTEYKRPDLLLRDPERLAALLTDTDRPMQLVIAGKAHPYDDWGKRAIQKWASLARRDDLRQRLIFLEDYDMTMAEELVRGVDLWLSTSRRPWEACGTSGMKVLVNGGLNLASLDGWWPEAYEPEVGWAVGDDAHDDVEDAARLYGLLEREVLREFHDRDETGIPRAWIARVRASMTRLSPRFSAGRMVSDYLERIYLPALERLRERTANGARLASELIDWKAALARGWASIHFGRLTAAASGAGWSFQVQVYLGEIDPGQVRVEMFADGTAEEPAPVRVAMEAGETLSGAAGGAVYHASIATTRPVGDFTPRVIPYHPAALVPLEAPWILWHR
jgi:starch phosphorylase